MQSRIGKKGKLSPLGLGVLLNLFLITALLPAYSYGQGEADAPASDTANPANEADAQLTKQAAIFSKVFFLAQKLEERAVALLPWLAAEEMKGKKSFSFKIRLPGRFNQAPQETEVASAQLTAEQITEIGQKAYFQRALLGGELALPLAYYDFESREGERPLDLSEPKVFEAGLDGNRPLGLGNAEATTINKEIVYRIFLPEVNTVFLGIPDLELLKNPDFREHYDIYVASLRSLADGGKGRNVLPFEMKRGEFTEGPNGPIPYQYLPIPETTGESWRSWWRAIYRKPDRQTKNLAWAAIVVQVIVNEAVNLYSYQIGKADHWDHWSDLIPFIFGYVVGRNFSTVANYTKALNINDPSSRLDAQIKRTLLTSVPYSLAALLYFHGLDALTVSGLLVMLRSSFFNGFSKDVGRKFVDVQEDMGIARKPVPILGEEYKGTTIRRLIVDHIIFVARTADLAGYSAFTWILNTSPVWGRYALYKYGKAVNYRKSGELLKDFKHVAYLKFVPGTFKYLGSKASWAWQKLNSCVDMLSGNQPEAEPKVGAPFTPRKDADDWQIFNPLPQPQE